MYTEAQPDMRSTRQFFLSVSTLVIFLVGISALTMAQDATPQATTGDFTLTYSVAASGEISDSTPSQTWTLTSASADRLMIRVERTSGNLLPDVSILNANDQQIALSYGSDYTGAAAQIDNYTLPGAGTYKVLVQRLDGIAVGWDQQVNP